MALPPPPAPPPPLTAPAMLEEELEDGRRVMSGPEVQRAPAGNDVSPADEKMLMQISGRRENPRTFTHGHRRKPVGRRSRDARRAPSGSKRRSVGRRMRRERESWVLHLRLTELLAHVQHIRHRHTPSLYHNDSAARGPLVVAAHHRRPLDLLAVSSPLDLRSSSPSSHSGCSSSHFRLSPRTVWLGMSIFMAEHLARQGTRVVVAEPMLDRRALVRLAVDGGDGVAHHLLRDRAT